MGGKHDVPNYRKLTPPENKLKHEYTWVERRAELYDMIEKAGHYRNLERSLRELGDIYGVSHTSISNDIDAIMEWQVDNMGSEAEVELIELKNAAVRDLIDKGEIKEAYKLMEQHYKMLQDMGVKEKEPDKHEISLKDAWKEALEEE